MKDWGTAKRPLKSLYTVINNSPIKFLIFICREKDLLKEDPNDSNKLIKLGSIWDGMKGLDYEMNLALHFTVDDKKKWQYEVTKVQGGLAKQFPLNSTGTKIDFPKLFEYAEHLKPSVGSEESEGDVADRIAKGEEKKIKKTQVDLVNFAKSYDISPADLATVLKAAGFAAYEPDKHAAMEQAILDYVSKRV